MREELWARARVVDRTDWADGLFTLGLDEHRLQRLPRLAVAARRSYLDSVLAVAVGIYLPLELTVPIFLGGLVAWAAGRYLVARRVDYGASFDETVAGAKRQGLLFASGLITGEALVGILLLPVIPIGYLLVMNPDERAAINRRLFRR